MVAIRNLGGMRCCRVFDALLACFAIAFFLPLMAAVAVVIKADSGGPVLRPPASCLPQRPMDSST